MSCFNVADICGEITAVSAKRLKKTPVILSGAP